jgi:hypothetical protein
MAFVWCVISANGAPVSTPTAAHGVASASERARSPLGATAPQPATVVGQRTLIRGAIPEDVIAYAKTLVNLPMGTEEVAEIGGQRYVFVLERHYHPPGFVGAPSGWHKGVTAYELH